MKKLIHSYIATWLRKKQRSHSAIQPFSVGQSLVEILVAVALMAILLPAILTGFVSSREGKAQQAQRISGVPLLKEAQDATRIFRDKNWAAFAVNGTYHPAISANTWVLSPGTETINEFTRSVVISDVSPPDPSMKKVTTTVSWTKPLGSSVSSTTYLSRYLGNAISTQTTQADFNAGTKTGVTVTNVSGGEVGLGSVSGSGSDWCTPNLSLNALDLPGQGIETAISAIQGHAYVTTGGNSSGHSMDSVIISNPPYPQSPVASNSGSYDYFKTYGIYATTNYVYLTSDHPNLTVDIINASTLARAGYFSGTEAGTGDSVFVSGNVGYVTAGNTLYSFDTATIINVSTSQTQLGSKTLAGTGRKVIIVGNYAYVATTNTSAQLQIINVATPNAMTIVGTVDANTLSGGAAGVDVTVNPSETLAYLVTTYIAGKKDFFVIDVSNKSSPQIIGSYSTNGMNPKGVAVVPGNKTIIVGSGGEQYQVLDMSTPSVPTRCGGLTSPNGATSINAIGSVLESDNDAYSYIVTNNASKEFQIIAGGQFASSGTFESSTIDKTATVTFNRFYANALQPPQTSLTYQVAAAEANQSTNDCTGLTFSYIGSDGTGNTYFATSSAIPLSGSGTYKNPGRCFRYKAFFSTNDITQSPILYDFIVNYSP